MLGARAKRKQKAKQGGDEEEVVFDLISSPVYLLFLCFSSSSSSVDPLDLFSIWPEYPRFPTLQIPGSSPLCQHRVYMYIGRTASNSSTEEERRAFCLLLPRLVSTYTLCLGTRREEKNHSDGSLWD